MDRKERVRRARAKRDSYLFAHTDPQTANYFITLWDSPVEAKVCEEQPRQSFSERKPIFTSDARNKLTEYGQKVALETLLAIPVIERVCKFARFDLEDLQARFSKGFSDEQEKTLFVQDRDHWFMCLKEKMKEHRISKEVLAQYRLDWKVCKSFAYQVI